MMSLSKLKISLRDYMVPTRVAVLAWPKKVLQFENVPCALCPENVHRWTEQKFCMA